MKKGTLTDAQKDAIVAAAAKSACATKTLVENSMETVDESIHVAQDHDIMGARNLLRGIPS